MHYFVKPRGGCIILLSLGEVYLFCFNKPRGGFFFFTMALLVSLGEEEWWGHEPGMVGFDNAWVDKPRGG